MHYSQGSVRRSKREAVDRVEFIERSEIDRLAPYRSLIKQVRSILSRYSSRIDVRSMPEKERKATLLVDEEQGILDERQPGLLPYLRATLPDESIQWLDTVLLLQSEGTRAAPLFISGGNDGNFDFSVAFMGHLQTLFTEPESIRDRLISALFGEGLVPTRGGTPGHFHPGGLESPNGGQGFMGEAGVNPWDFVLMVEGAILLAGAVVRRLGIESGDRAAFPFCVMPVAAGFGSAAGTDETSDTCRTELWLPLWTRPCSLREIRHLLAEGRAQLGRRQARNATDFALAACLLGVNRGIDTLVRFGFLRRYGKMFLAAPLGRVPVVLRPKGHLLLDDALVRWLDRLRSACRDKDKTPSRFQAVLRRIDRALYEFAARSERGDQADRRALVQVLRALGAAERTLSRALQFCEKNYIRPLQSLDPRWLDQASDDSPEFRLAASIAGIRERRKIGSIRDFIEPVEREGRSFAWAAHKSESAVWSNRPLDGNLAAIFRRRQLEAFRTGENGTPLNSPCPALLSDVIGFLDGETDDDKIADLLWALTAVDWASVDENHPAEPFEGSVPFEYGLPRLLVQPRGIAPVDARWVLAPVGGLEIRPDTEVFDILASGQAVAVGRCVDRAARRMKSSGLLVHGYRNRARAGRPLGVQTAVPADRLLAAILFPLSDRDIEKIANDVLFPPESKQ